MTTELFLLLREINTTLPPNRFLAYQGQEILDFHFEPVLCFELNNEKYVGTSSIAVQDIQLFTE
ncbi:hypothetical protein [Alteromonas gilva]|uniref:Uncharacterized protein n=1 Tax=Alteromonas gilva TaxID=2987522 RepID=A0ABT5L797_9ALTE|nr:hypothetical protein [Alteromonas gilva]MDC8832939.1 hypothetical protein [Alteromonas gilva]